TKAEATALHLIGVSTLQSPTYNPEMQPIKNAFVDIFWLMVAAITMTLVGLVFIGAAVYVSFAVLASLFMGTEALGTLPYGFGIIAIAAGAGAILLLVGFVNRKDDPRFADRRAPHPHAAAEQD